MKRFVFFLFFVFFFISNSYAYEIVINYTPVAYSGVVDKKDVVEQNSILDKAGFFYFSRTSLVLYDTPESIDVSDEVTMTIGQEKASDAHKKRGSWGVFFDLMHDEVKINSVDIQHFENGGMVHFYTGALGISYKLIIENNFFTEYGFGIIQTSMFGNSWRERSNAESTDWLFKMGVGYKMNILDTNFINIGIDLTASLFNSYHKKNDGDFIKFIHQGIYPYIGIEF